MSVQPAPQLRTSEPRAVSQTPVEHEPRNTALMALHAVVVRIGWIFKTESVIMPAFLDSIGGAGWLRGLLPVFNRAGQSVPSFLLVRRLKVTPLKKRVLCAASAGMALPFLLLSFVLGAGAANSEASALWLPALFLLLYGIFFGFAGLNQIVTGTLSGKLIRPDRRGRLLALSTFGGTVPACILAWWLLPGWLESQPPAYDQIFLFSGVCFGLAGVFALALREPRDRRQEDAVSLRDQLRGALQILRINRDYRRLVVVAALFSSSIMIFPHYQALARERLDLGGGSLMVWVVAQNLSMGVASLVMGPLADRLGNRASLQIVTFAAALIPLAAVGLTTLEPDTARRLFPLLFVGIGLTPIGFRLLTNYTLELTPAEEHPRYLSLTQLCTAAVFVVSPGFGLLIDLTSFELVFLLEAGLMTLGGILTFRLVEPRERSHGS